MSYGIRNTLILLAVLLLFVGAGWAYLYFVQGPEIEALENQLSQKRTELNKKQQIANQYPQLVKNFENAKFYIENYDKALYRDNNEDKVFDFLNDLNTGNAYVDFSFSYNDSTSQGQYGILEMEIQGEGYYRNLVNFIRKIELSKPINKTRDFTLNPINELEEYGKVTFSFTLDSFYDRARILENTTFDITTATLSSLYNPFYPHIQEQIRPNDDNLVNVEASQLLALSADRVFLLDQTGSLKRLHVGDEVYLGNLRSVNLKDKTATFVLNKGGIIEQITMEVNLKSNVTDDASN